jgi:hypothetical protein
VTINLGALDFVLTTLRILENCGLQVTVEATVAFLVKNLDIEVLKDQ